MKVFVEEDFSTAAIAAVKLASVIKIANSLNLEMDFKIKNKSSK